MTGLLTRNRPPLRRVLLIESGTRQEGVRLLRHLYESGEGIQVDLLTCYPDPLEEFQSSRGKVFLVTDPAIARYRRQFIRTLMATPYDTVAVLHTGSAVLRKWKRIIMLLTRAKVMVMKEGANFIFLDYGCLPNSRVNVPHFRPHHMARLHLLGEVLFMPLTISYLLLYAAAAHLRRLLHSGAASRQ